MIITKIKIACFMFIEFPMADLANLTENSARPETLAVRHSQNRFGKALALNWNLGSCRIDLIEILRRQVDGSGAHVFFQSMYLGCSGNRDNPGLLGKQPGERDLGGRCVPSFRDHAEQVDNSLVGFPSLLRKPRK